MRAARFSLAVHHAEAENDEPPTVAIVGEPVAPALADGTTAEVPRVCAAPSAPKGACSMLLAAAWRGWRAMAGRRLVTYTLAGESGASLPGLKQQGWRLDAEVRPRKPGARAHRPGRRALAIEGERKLRWCVATADRRQQRAAA